MNDSLGTVIAIMKMLSNNRHGNATFSGISDSSARTGRREVVENLTIWSDRKGKTKEANMKKNNRVFFDVSDRGDHCALACRSEYGFRNCDD